MMPFLDWGGNRFGITDEALHIHTNSVNAAGLKEFVPVPIEDIMGVK